MPLSFTHKYTLAEAEEGAMAFYGEFTGNRLPVGDLALAFCAIADYAASLGLPPSQGKTALPDDEASLKAAAVAMLKPAKGAMARDWAALLAMLMKLLPFILPFLKPAP